MTFTARMKLLGLGTSLGLLASLGGVQAQETIKLGLSVPLSGSGAIWGKGSEFMCKKAAQEIGPDLVKLLIDAYNAVKRDEKGYVSLNELGTIAGNRSSFDARNYGFSRLGDLIETVPNFQTERREGGRMYVKRVR